MNLLASHRIYAFAIIIGAFSSPASAQNNIDLSKYCPTKEYQYRSTCYAYAFAYTALTINYCVKNNITKRQDVENNAFSSGFIASIHRLNTRFNPYCGKYGSYDVDTAIFTEHGCPKLKDFRYDCTNHIPKTVYELAEKTRLDHFEYFQSEEDESPQAVEKIKRILDQKIPVLIVVHMTDDFDNIDSTCDTKLPVLSRGEKSRTAHDICIIGYDDRPGSPTNGRFLVKNNYSTWGNKQAMAWVRYSDMMYMIAYAAYFTIK
jgi:hypothetical protein